MKNKKLILSISCLLLISLFVTGCKQEIEIKDGSKVAVSVDGGKVTATDYYQKIKETNVSILIDMIDHKLFDKKYPSTKEEDERVEKVISQLKESYKDETTLNAALAQFYGVSNEDELEEMLRLEYKREQAIKDYISENIKDSEVEKYYKDKIFGQVKAKHILIIPSTSDGATEDEIKEAESEAKKTAEEVIEKLEKGEDFSKLAKKYSQDTATATNGGDLGYFELDEMVDEFSDAVKELDKNEYTKKPVKTTYGYHIILKTDQKAKPKLKDVEKDIRKKITLQKLDADPKLYYQTLIDIRKAKNIKWNDTVLEDKYNDLMDQLLEAAEQSAKSNQ